MKIIELIKKYKKFFIIAGIFLFILIVSFINPKKSSQNKVEQNNNSEIVNLKDKISPTLEPEQFDVTNSDPDYPLVPFLPYQGEGFIIERYTAPLVLSVRVNKKSDIPKAEALLKQWLVSKELIPGENKIIWNYNQ